MKNRRDPGSLLQLAGIHPFVAILTISIDTMLFAESSATLGVGWLISIPVSMILALIAMIIQKKSYGDGWFVSMAKGLGIGLLTAIPTPLPATITAGLGVLGLIKGHNQIESNQIEDKNTSKANEKAEDAIIIDE